MSTIIVANDFAHINGGAAQIALSSTLALAERGHKVILFSAVPPIFPRLKHSNLDVICLNQYEIAKDPNRIRAFTQGIWNVPAKRKMEKVLAECDPSHTVVHFHGWTKALSSSVIRTCITQGFKSICSLQDYFLACPNGGFYLYPKGEICHWEPLSWNCISENCDKRNYAQKLWRIGRQVVQQNFGLMPEGLRYFIVCSELIRSVLQPYLPPLAKVFHVDNPIVVKKNPPVDVSKNRAFCLVGRLSREKGCALFARAGLAVGCETVFIGGGECHQELSMRYPSSRITGWCAREDVLKYLYSARVLVFPSLWYEAEPLVVLEAAALGIPVIVADSCAGRENVIDGETGIWFRGGDEKDLAQKMLLLMNNNELLRQLGQEAYNRYWANPFTLESHVSRLEKVYEEVLVS